MTTREQEVASTWIENCRKAIRFGSASKEAEDTFWAYSELDRLCSEDPSQALAVILKILHMQPEERVLHNLSAGPLEDLLRRNGPKVIATIEHLADTDSAFLYLIGSVWPDRMADEVEQRIRPLIKRSSSVPVPGRRVSEDH